jgi:hypothetical protein
MLATCGCRSMGYDDDKQLLLNLPPCTVSYLVRIPMSNLHSFTCVCVACCHKLLCTFLWDPGGWIGYLDIRYVHLLLGGGGLPRTMGISAAARGRRGCAYVSYHLTAEVPCESPGLDAGLEGVQTHGISLDRVGRGELSCLQTH